MKNLTFSIATVALSISAHANAAPFSLTNTDGTPLACETALKELRSMSAATPPAANDKAKFEELQTKGVERCNADDDKRADEFFGKAMTMLKK